MRDSEQFDLIIDYLMKLRGKFSLILLNFFDGALGRPYKFVNIWQGHAMNHKLHAVCFHSLCNCAFL